MDFEKILNLGVEKNIINEDNMFVSKDTTIDTILSVLNNFLNENE